MGCLLSKNRLAKQLIEIICYEENKELAFELIEKGANLNYQDDYGFTPLAKSCQWRINKNIAIKMIDSGANVNLQSFSRKLTALMLACRDNSTDVANYLIDHGADV